MSARDRGNGSDLRKVLAIAGTGMRRMVRERSNLFFIFVFPLLLILVLGTVFGGGFRPVLGVVAPHDGALADDVVAALDRADEVDVQRYDSEGALRSAVERGSARAGVVVPADYTERLTAGERTEVGFLSRPDGTGAELRTVVQAALGEQSARVQAAQFAAAEGFGSFDQALATATEQQRSLGAITVRTTTVGEELFTDEQGQFGPGASSQLLLFMFVNGLASSSALILSRQLGVSRRMLSTPTSSRVVLLGEAVGHFAVVAFQGIYIVTATLLLFGVNWGDPVGALALLVAFAAVATGAAMLMGALFRNEQQAGGVGVVLGLGLAALGGCMAPLALFSPTMRTIAHVTPHAWALDGFTELTRDDGNVADILPELGVLVAMAVALLALGAWQLRRAITRP